MRMIHTQILLEVNKSILHKKEINNKGAPKCYVIKRQIAEGHLSDMSTSTIKE